MSSESLPQPQPGHRRGLWIAGGVLAALLALFTLADAVVARFSEPIKIAYGYVSGNPSVPNCRTTITREAAVGPLWYRVRWMRCALSD